jgi:hypothetical protein
VGTDGFARVADEEEKIKAHLSQSFKNGTPKTCCSLRNHSNVKSSAVEMVITPPGRKACGNEV